MFQHYLDIYIKSVRKFDSMSRASIRVWMVVKDLRILVLWTKVTSVSKGLGNNGQLPVS